MTRMPGQPHHTMCQSPASAYGLPGWIMQITEVNVTPPVVARIVQAMREQAILRTLIGAAKVVGPSGWETHIESRYIGRVLLSTEDCLQLKAFWKSMHEGPEEPDRWSSITFVLNPEDPALI